MIKFFRHIRKSLIEAGRVRRYVLYALGEITLVVIGILIALQVNNWNEERKNISLEKKLLTELQKSLERNCDQMISDIEARESWNKSSDIIISILEEGGLYTDTLDIHFQDARKPGTNLSLSNAGYEGLKNAGFNIIRSDELRNEIIELFEVTQEALLEEMEYFESFQPDRQQFIDALFSYDHTKFDESNPFAVPLIPHDFAQLKNNPTFLAMIKSVKVQRKIITVMLKKNLRESRRVLQLIGKELGIRYN